MPRAMGAEIDPVDDRDKDVGELLASVSVGGPQRPASYSLRQYIPLDAAGAPRIFDQLQASSCVGNWLSMGMWIRQGREQAAGTAVVQMPDPPSRLQLYYNARLIVLIDQGRDPRGIVLTDKGSSPRAAVKGANRFGFCAEPIWPYSDDPQIVNERPSPLADWYARDQATKLDFYRATSTGDALVEEVKSLLWQGFPVGITTSVDAAYEAWDGSGALPAPTGTSLGLHRWSLIGYNSDGSFEGLGSWGTSWGNQGFADRVDPAMLSHHQTADLIAIRQVPRYTGEAT